MLLHVLCNHVQVITNKIPERKCLMVHLQTLLSVSYEDIPCHFCSTLCSHDVEKRKKELIAHLKALKIFSY